MNERNVAALTAIIERVYGVKLSEPGKYPVLARELAAEGVLVPGALTPEQTQRIRENTCINGPCEECHAADVQWLARIAKGET